MKFAVSGVSLLDDIFALIGRKERKFDCVKPASFLKQFGKGELTQPRFDTYCYLTILEIALSCRMVLFSVSNNILTGY